MKKSRRVLMAGAAAMVFSSVVGSAAFLTLNTPRADFLPESSVWTNNMLPTPAEQKQGYGKPGNADFLAMDFAAYGSAFTGAGGSGPNELASLSPSDRGSESGSNAGAEDNGSGANAGAASSSPQTFSSISSPWDALRSELEKSIEPGAGRAGSGASGGGGGGDSELAELNPDDTMTPDPDQQLHPDQQPLPERPVAEPQSWALLLLGLASLGALRYRQSA